MNERMNAPRVIDIRDVDRWVDLRTDIEEGRWDDRLDDIAREVRARKRKTTDPRPGTPARGGAEYGEGGHVLFRGFHVDYCPPCRAAGVNPRTVPA